VAAVTAVTKTKDVPVAQPPVAVQVSEPDIVVAQAVEALIRLRRIDNFLCSMPHY
jgi:hypothetical protein